ncbi:MAG: hypothetical protein EB117_13195 [Betaproteobacteria bacterium]|nr:hypothetical protein [Betaproteobacteria bacterium]
MAPPRKPPERRQRTNTPDIGVVVALPASSPAVPAPDPTWRSEVVEAWNDFWCSPLAGPGVMKATDAPALRRLFAYRSRLLVALEAMDAEPIVLGSTGQPTMSPWAAEVHRLEAAIAKLEQQFGLTPMARLKLGVTYEEGVSLAHRNAQLLEAFRTAQS